MAVEYREEPCRSALNRVTGMRMFNWSLTRLVEAGIEAGVGMAPILPGLSDRPDLLADVVKAARDAGATSIWTNVLYLRPGTREHFLENLARDWPELMPQYERLYAGRAYLPNGEVEPIRREVAELADRFGIADRRVVRPLPAPSRSTGTSRNDAEQLALGIHEAGSEDRAEREDRIA
jgi:hypothetical protein